MFKLSKRKITLRRKLRHPRVDSVDRSKNPEQVSCEDDSKLTTATSDHSGSFNDDDAKSNASMSTTSLETWSEAPINSKKQDQGLQDAGSCGGRTKQEHYENHAPQPTDTNEYVYEDAAPDVANACEDGEEAPDLAKEYGYGDASPDLAAQSVHQDDGYAKYYGYGETSPCPDREEAKQATSQRTPRRSSMKGSGALRRNSIQATGEIEVTLPGKNKTRVRRRTSITFGERVQVKEISPASDLIENSKELWFQDEDYKRMVKKSLDLVSKVEIDGTLTSSGRKKYCMRGLEKMMAPEVVSVKRSQAWDSVLTEQYLQRKFGDFDETNIANIYKFSTLRSQVEAAKRASKDAEDAETYLKTERRRYRRRMSM